MATLMTPATSARAPRAAVRLCARQRELYDRLCRLDSDANRATERDCAIGELSDRAAQLLIDEQVERLRAVTDWELDQIDDALARIASGSYGVCACCAGAIDSTRLEAQPYVALCVRCSERGDRRPPS